MVAVSILVGIAGVLLAVLATVAALLLVAVTALLCLPLEFSGRAESDLALDEESEAGYTGTVRWQGLARFGWGLLRLQVAGQGGQLTDLQVRICGMRPPARGKRQQSAATPRKPSQKKKEKKKRRLPTWEEVLIYMREGQLFLRRVFKLLRLNLRGDVTIGLEDPASTGLLLGFLYASGIAGSGLRAQGDFVTPKLAGWLKVTGRTHGIELAAAALLAWLNLPGPKRWRQRIKQRFTRSHTYVGGRA